MDEACQTEKKERSSVQIAATARCPQMPVRQPPNKKPFGAACGPKGSHSQLVQYPP